MRTRTQEYMQRFVDSVFTGVGCVIAAVYIFIFTILGCGAYLLVKLVFNF